MTAKLDDMVEFEEQTENAFKNLKRKEQEISDLEGKVERKTKQLHETEERLADTLDKVENLETKVTTKIELIGDVTVVFSSVSVKSEQRQNTCVNFQRSPTC